MNVSFRDRVQGLAASGLLLSKGIGLGPAPPRTLPLCPTLTLFAFPSSSLEYIRLSTTVATNALLERKGAKHALITTKGFKDLVQIGNQSRPSIFDLAIRKPEVLYSKVLEIDERVTLVGYTSDPEFRKNQIQFKENGEISKEYSGEDFPPPVQDGSTIRYGNDEIRPEIKEGVSGEAVAILKRPDRDVVRRDLESLYAEGYRTLAIVLIHSYTYPGEPFFSRIKLLMYMVLTSSFPLLPLSRPRGNGC